MCVLKQTSAINDAFIRFTMFYLFAENPHNNKKHVPTRNWELFPSHFTLSYNCNSSEVARYNCTTQGRWCRRRLVTTWVNRTRRHSATYRVFCSSESFPLTMFLFLLGENANQTRNQWVWGSSLSTFFVQHSKLSTKPKEAWDKLSPTRVFQLHLLSLACLKLLRSFPSSKNRSQPGRKLRQKVRDISRETFTNSKSDSLGRRLLGPFKNVRAKSFIQKVTQKKEPPQKYHPKRATLFKEPAGKIAPGTTGRWWHFDKVLKVTAMNAIQPRSICHLILVVKWCLMCLSLEALKSSASKWPYIQSMQLHVPKDWMLLDFDPSEIQIIFHVRKVHPTWFKTQKKPHWRWICSSFTTLAIVAFWCMDAHIAWLASKLWWPGS